VGERYTRNAAWVVDMNGDITDSQGNYLLGNAGPINVAGDSAFIIDEDGNVSANGAFVDQIRIVDFADRGALRKEGDNLYAADAAAVMQAPADVRVMQGFLEGSNVDIAREMVDMMTVYRVYETNQRMLTMVDETVGKAVNDIGRLR
jgi:flagellar basal-body rod protein FlgG